MSLSDQNKQEYKDKIKTVGQLLEGSGWTFVEPEYDHLGGDFAYKDTGVEVYSMLIASKGKFTFRATGWPKSAVNPRWDFYPFGDLAWAKGCEVGISLEKTPDVIAKELRRRILDPIIPAIEQALAARDAFDKRATASIEIENDLASCIEGGEIRKDWNDESKRRIEFSRPNGTAHTEGLKEYTLRASATAFVSHDGVVSVSFDRLRQGQAKALLVKFGKLIPVVEEVSA